MGRDPAWRAAPLDKGRLIVIQAVRDFLVSQEIRRFRAVIATVLLGAWVIASVILMYARLTVPDNTNTSVDTSIGTPKQPDASHAESIFNSKGRARELSTNLSVSLRDGDCLAVMTAELRLMKDDPLFAALETGRLSLSGSQEVGSVGIGEAFAPYNDVAEFEFNSAVVIITPDLDAVHIDKNSNTATVSYRDDTQISSSEGCGSSLGVEYRCEELQYCPSNRAFTLTVGPGLGIDHVVEGLADTQRRDRVMFTELKPYQGVVVVMSIRDQTIQIDTSTIEELIDVLSTSLWDGDFSLALVVPLVILALSKTRRYSLDIATRVITSVVICSTTCALLATSVFYIVYSLTYIQPIENAAYLLLYVSEIAEIATPSLALLVLVSVFVALPLTLSILVARRRGQNINRSIWILIISVACAPLILAAVIQALGWVPLSPQEVVLVVIVVTLPIMVMIALRGIRWNLILLSMLTGTMTAIFATSIFPDEELSSGVLAFSFPLVSIPLCVLSLSDRRRTTRAAVTFVLVTMLGVLELVVASFWYIDGVSSLPDTIYDPVEWAAVILLTLELGLFVLLVLMMIGGTTTAASIV